jgi:hypothetical protein
MFVICFLLFYSVVFRLRPKLDDKDYPFFSVNWKENDTRRELNKDDVKVDIPFRTTFSLSLSLSLSLSIL